MENFREDMLKMDHMQVDILELELELQQEEQEDY